MEDNEELQSMNIIEEQMEIERVVEIGRVLGYGIPSNIFIESFNSLSSNQKDILDRVAKRLETIKRFSYEALFISNPHLKDHPNFVFGRWQLPSIQIYLYCSCMDTLAGGDKDYVFFQDWLKTHEDLSHINVGEKYETYAEKYGNTRNFKKLFTEQLPSKTKNWLNSHVAILESTKNKVLEDRNNEVLPNRDEGEFIKRLQKYFYTYWRNPFTHESIDRPVDLFNATYLQLFSGTQKDWARQGDSFTFDKKSKTKWDLWHKKGLDIGIISRIVIHSVVFQWLGIEVTDELLNKNVYFLHRLHWMYLYIHEIRNNAHYLKLWKDIEEEYSQKFMLDLQNSGIFSVGDDATIKILEFFGAKNNFEDSIREHIQNYIDCIKEINTAINNFNKENISLRDLHSQEEIQRHQQKIKDFLSKWTDESAYKEIIKYSRQDREDIWFLIRDNHQYESKDMRR